MIPLCPKHHKEIHFSDDVIKMKDIEMLLISYEKNRGEKYFENLKNNLTKEDKKVIFSRVEGDSLNRKDLEKYLLKKY